MKCSTSQVKAYSRAVAKKAGCSSVCGEQIGIKLTKWAIRVGIATVCLIASLCTVQAQTCTLNATPATFASQLAATAPGQTLCLATGNYGTFSGVVKTSPGVTITAASGATPTMNINFTGSPAWLILEHLTIPGGTVSGSPNNITFQNNTWTDKLQIYTASMNNSNILFNGEMFNMASNQSGSGGYEGRIQFILGGPKPAGLTIKNSNFTTGCADGIQGGGAGWGNGVTIGPGNQFYGLLQGNCGPHVDSIQFNGSENSPNSATGPVITGNYFYNDATGIVSYDYDSDGQITDNVLVGISGAIGLAGFDSKSIAEHNTVINGTISCDETHEGNICKAAIRNNITGNIVTTSSGGTGSPTLSDYNLCTSGTCPGSHSLGGKPTFVGGSSPTTYAGYQLATNSLGSGKASDGNDIGINVGAPLPPTAPTISAQPANQSVNSGQSATFTVSALGTAPLSYQWSKNGILIPGATSVSYTTPITSASDSGAQFSVVVSNSVGSVGSSVATLTVIVSVPVAPSITTQPTSQSVTVGQTATFTVTAAGTPPLSYQWSSSGVPISGATSTSYSTTAVSSNSGTVYTVTVSNSVGSITSSAVTLTVKASVLPAVGAMIATPSSASVRAVAVNNNFGTPIYGTEPPGALGTVIAVSTSTIPNCKNSDGSTCVWIQVTFNTCSWSKPANATACTGWIGSDNMKVSVPVPSIAISPTSASVLEGGTVQFTAQEVNTTAPVVWSANAPNGVFTAGITPGPVAVTATAGTATASVTVTVTAPPEVLNISCTPQAPVVTCVFTPANINSGVPLVVSGTADKATAGATVPLP